MCWYVKLMKIKIYKLSYFLVKPLQNHTNKFECNRYNYQNIIILHTYLLMCWYVKLMKIKIYKLSYFLIDDKYIYT